MQDVYEYTFSRRKVAEIGAGIIGYQAAYLAAAAVIRPDEREDEAIAVILLNTKNQVIGTEIVVMGGTSSAGVRIAQIFRAAVRLNATRLIMAHNHPSGDPAPSPDDLHLTAEAKAAGKLLDIDVLDHLVLGANGAYTSLAERGYMGK